MTIRHLEPAGHGLPPSPCPACGKVNDSAEDTASVDGSRPTPGDYAVCFSCAAVAVYADDMTLRDPTRRELEEAPGELWIAQRQVKAWLATGGRS